MNKLQPDTPLASTFFDSSLFSQNSSHTIPDTLASAIPETIPEIKDISCNMKALEEQETVALPTLRLPQVSPSRVIATRQRALSSVPGMSLRPVSFVASSSSAPSCRLMEKQECTEQKQSAGTTAGTAPLSPILLEPQTPHADILPQLYHMPNAPVTPRPNSLYEQGKGVLTGVTYIPRSMERHTQPTVVDALIACGTLVLMFFCLLLFLYFVGL